MKKILLSTIALSIGSTALMAGVITASVTLDKVGFLERAAGTVYHQYYVDFTYNSNTCRLMIPSDDADVEKGWVAMSLTALSASKSMDLTFNPDNCLRGPLLGVAVSK